MATMIFERKDDHLILKEYHGSERVVYIPEQATIDGELLVVREIADYTFQESFAEYVVLPMSIRTIGKCTFASESIRCVGVHESIHHSVLPPELETIGEAAFMGSRIKDLSITSPHICIGNLCFSGSTIESVLFYPTEKVLLGKSAFAGSTLEQFVAPNIERLDVPERCFSGCNALSKINLGGGKIYQVGSFGFSNCESLEEIAVQQPLELGYCALDGCSVQTAGLYRNLLSFYQSNDTERLADCILNILVPTRRLPFSLNDEWNNIAEAAVHRVLNRIHNIHQHDSNLGLIHCKTASCASPGANTTVTDSYALYSLDNIKKQFTYISSFELSTNWRAEDLHFPLMSLDMLTDTAVLSMLENENCPEALPWQWDLDTLMTAQLLGDFFFFPEVTAMSFLLMLVRHDLGHMEEFNQDVPNRYVNAFYFPKEEHLEQAQILHRLRYGLLYNRISTYKQLALAYYQLMEV